LIFVTKWQALVVEFLHLVEWGSQEKMPFMTRAALWVIHQVHLSPSVKMTSQQPSMRCCSVNDSKTTRIIFIPLAGGKRK